MCVHGFVLILIDLPFFTFPYVYVHLHLPFHLNILSFFFQVIGMLSITSHVMPPFQKICGNCHLAIVTIFPTCGVYCTAYCSNSTIQ